MTGAVRVRECSRIVRPRSVLTAAALTLVTAATAPALSAHAADRPKFDVKVLTTVPDPGYTALTVLGPDRTIYGGTFYPVSGNGGDGIPSKLFAWTPDGKLERTYEIAGQDLAQDHGVQATVVDAQGRVVLLDTSPARVLRLDPTTGEQTTYATIPDLPSCAAGQDPAATPCSRTLADNAPEPDYAAWGPDGSLYVTDTAQATIFRIPRGGGPAQIWLTDARFDVAIFGLTGLALLPDQSGLAATVVGANPTSDLMPSNGRLVEIPFLADGSPGPVKEVWQSGPLQAPDGFAYGVSGHAYVSLLGPGANQVVEVTREGKQVGAFPSTGQDTGGVPFDSPSSVVFDGDRLLVTNDAYFSADRSHQAIYDVAAGEQGAPLLIPGRTETNRLGKVRAQVTPRTVRRGRRARLKVTAQVVLGSSVTPVPAGTLARAAGRRGVFDAQGAATVRLVGGRSKALHVRVRVPGATPAVVTVRIRGKR